MNQSSKSLNVPSDGPGNGFQQQDNARATPVSHHANVSSSTTAISADHGLLERRYAIARAYNEHGVCVFDQDQTLVLSNNQYATLYGLNPSDVKVGMSLREILALRIKKGIYGNNGAAAYEREWLRTVTRRRTRIQDLIDGRCILIVQQPTTNGYWITTHEDITERLQMEAQVTFLATRDPLTGLANRAALMARLIEELGQLHSSSQACVMLLDLDHFKPINDTYGHDIGDEVLKIAAARIRSHARDTDTVARLGGDEFVVVQTPVIEKARIAKRASGIVMALAEPFETSVGLMSLSASIGVALTGTAQTTPDALLKAADLALYSAKNAGRGTYHINDLSKGPYLATSTCSYSSPLKFSGGTMNRLNMKQKPETSFGQRPNRTAPSSQRPMAPVAASQATSEDERRLDERVATSFRANVYCHGRYQSIVVQNVSCGGLMMVNAFGLARGDNVTVTTLDGRTYAGRVAWTVSPYTGIKFDTRIAHDDLLFETPNGRHSKRRIL